MGKLHTVSGARAALLAAILGHDIGELLPSREPQEKPTRPCLHCGKPKKHNNSFCSAECCRAHTRKDRPHA